jgi:hypothetical protein
MPLIVQLLIAVEMLNSGVTISSTVHSIVGVYKPLIVVIVYSAAIIAIVPPVSEQIWYDIVLLRKLINKWQGELLCDCIHSVMYNGEFW